MQRQRRLGKREKYHLFFDGGSVINTPGISLILAEKLECVHSTNTLMLAIYDQGTGQMSL